MCVCVIRPWWVNDDNLSICLRTPIDAASIIREGACWTFTTGKMGFNEYFIVWVISNKCSKHKLHLLHIEKSFQFVLTCKSDRDLLSHVLNMSNKSIRLVSPCLGVLKEIWRSDWQSQATHWRLTEVSRLIPIENSIINSFRPNPIYLTLTKQLLSLHGSIQIIANYLWVCSIIKSVSSIAKRMKPVLALLTFAVSGSIFTHAL